MSKESDLLSKLMKGVGFLFLGMLLSKLGGYVFRVLIARFLGPDAYGLFSLGFAIVGVLATISLLGLTQGIVRYIAEYKAINDTKKILSVVRSSLLLSGGLSIIFASFLFFFSDFIAIFFFSDADLGIILRVMSFAIPITVLLTIFEKTILAFQKVEYITFSRNIGENFVKVSLAAVFVLMGYGIVLVSSAYVFSLFCGMILLFLSLHLKIFSLNGIFKSKVKVLKKLLKFSLPLLLTDVFIFLLSWADTLIIGYFMLSSDVGIYNAAVPTALLVYVVPTALRTMFYPVLSEEYTKKQNYVGFFKKVTDWLIVLTVPVAVYLIIFSRHFLELFFGQIYGNGYLVVIVVCLGYFAHALVNTQQIMLYVMKKTKLIMFNTVVAVVVNILLNILLIPTYGLIGAGLSTGISLLVSALLFFGEVTYIMKFTQFTKRAILPFVAVLIPSLLSVLVMNYVTSIILLIIGSLLFAIVYGIILLFLKFFGKEDLEIIKRVENKLPFKLNFVWKVIQIFS